MVDRSLRILFIENSQPDVEAILKVIKQSGYEVTAERVETRAGFQKALARHLWDVILCEYRLPRISAMVALALLEKNSLEIPLIITSGSIGEEAVASLLKAGASDFVHKGTWTRLLPAITDALELIPSLKEKKKTTREVPEVNISQREREEETLRQFLERFQAVVENAPDGIALVDRDGHGTIISPAGSKMLGWTIEGNNAVNLMERVHPDDLAKVVSALTNLIKDPTGHHTLVHRFKQEGGGWLWVESTFTNPLSLKSTATILIIYRDITERMETEDALQKQEHQIRALVTSLDDIVFEIDGQGMYLQAWTTNESLLAMPTSQLLGKRMVEVLGKEIGALWEDVLSRVLQSGTSETIEYPLEVVNGRRWFMARISPIFKVGGSPTSVVALVRDITDRKRDGAKINEQLARLKALQDVDRMITSSSNILLSLDQLIARTSKLLAADAVDIRLLDPIENVFKYRVGIGFRTNAIQLAIVRLGDSLAGKVALERRTAHIQNLEAEVKNIPLTDALKKEDFISYSGVPMTIKGKVIGVMELFDRSIKVRDQDWMNFLEMLAGQAAIMVEDSRLLDELQNTNTELTMAYNETIEGWSRAMDLRDKETEGHSQRVTEWTLRLARRIGFREDELVHVQRGALLHDLGKIGVPDRILQKPGPLTEKEWVQMRKHPLYAYEMLAPIKYLYRAIDIPYCHHERIDGTGYPRGLKGEEIPLAARIFSVVDQWDALTSDRPYRKAWSPEKALEYIREQAGRQFDPKVVELFLSEILKAGRHPD